MALAEGFVTKGAWVSHLVLAETTWVLSSEMLLKHDRLTLQAPDAVAAKL